MKKRYRLSLSLLLPMVLTLATGIGWSAPGLKQNVSANSTGRLPSIKQLETAPKNSIRNRILWPQTDTGKDPLSTLVLVNKEQPLSPEFCPPDLVVPKTPFSFDEDLPKKKMRRQAAIALEKMFAAAKDDHINLIGVSAFRSFERQKEIFDYKSRLLGQEAANRVSARPGESEHQTGLAIDLSSPTINGRLIEAFSQTAEGKWLAKNAARFGFIIRYSKEKTKITGYQYEPWHLRYVGPQHATEMVKRDLTLEEYLSVTTDELRWPSGYAAYSPPGQRLRTLFLQRPPQ